MKSILWTAGLSLILIACESKPKVVSEDTSSETNQTTTNEAAPKEQIEVIAPPPGGISIADLMANQKKYDGQVIKVKGRCIKVNNMIMDRNWIHLQDGSMQDGNIDLTVTTKDNVAVGAIVAFEGKISLNKDFGAGYTYEIIMEDAHLLP